MINSVIVLIIVAFTYTLGRTDYTHKTRFKFNFANLYVNFDFFMLKRTILKTNYRKCILSKYW